MGWGELSQGQCVPPHPRPRSSEVPRGLSDVDPSHQQEPEDHEGSDEETHSKECEEGWAGQGEASGEHLPSPSGQGELWSKGDPKALAEGRGEEELGTRERARSMGP